jgi:endonuclease/exonuclease/phosphatase family metal-dependent hydrolase
MRLVSYNILDGGTGRADPLAEIILAQRPDVVAIMEATDTAVVERIAMRCGMDFFRGGDDQQAAAILSRWPITETVDHAALHGEMTKSFVEAVIAAPDGMDWPIGIVHLHAGAKDSDERRREEEIRIVLDVFKARRAEGRPHLLVGDINSNSPEQEIDPARCKPSTRDAWQSNGGRLPRRVVEAIREAGYIDSLQAYDPRQARTSATFTTLHPGQRVDYIFTHGVETSRTRLAWIEQDRLARYASDHFPIGVELG